MGSDWQAAEDAEVRLESRSRERRASLERRDRRRRWLPWLICPTLLPAAGAAALVALFDSSEAGRSSGDVAALAAAGVLVPALLAGWVGRRHGKVDAVLWALVCVAIELALAFGVGFVALDLGP